MLLTVKADVATASKLAMDRGMVVTGVQSFERVGYALIEVQDTPRAWSAASRWFTEPLRSEPGQGFPTGSLLLYR